MEGSTLQPLKVNSAGLSDAASNRVVQSHVGHPQSSQADERKRSRKHLSSQSTSLKGKLKNRKRNRRTPAASNDCYEHVWLGQLAKKKLGLRPDSPVTLAILVNSYGGCFRGVALQVSIPTSSVRTNILPANESQKIRRHEFGINFEQDIQSFTCRSLNTYFL
ncbi:hypothetical protein, variant [Puccinia striiformis f. sp. tritici PST-78]|uniref:Uncharacterized protein n=2 Tax=Puccinia striiformis TaxID=27350 RepID=A0A0L0V6F0_9BASI|nr:hypothetical protein, variant [Puccinia striiformis f. sp. tritici PST-78]